MSDTKSLHPSPISEGTCSIDGCSREVMARGWCRKHYNRWHRYADPMGSGRQRGRPTATRYMSLAAKLEYHSIPEPNSGCYLWLGTVVRDGYGKMYHAGQYRAAHRWAWIAAHGMIDESLKCCHKCDNPACVNPDHLWLGTDADNAADKVRKGRQARRPQIVAGRLASRARALAGQDR